MAAGGLTFQSPQEAPEEYRELLVRMLSIQLRIEAEYMYCPERTLVAPLRVAPTPADRVEYAKFYADEVRHAAYWKELLAPFGVDIDLAAIEATPSPLYIFDMRNEATTWIDFAFYSFFADRQGAYMGYEWRDCSYRPLAARADEVYREEVGHAHLGERMIARACATPEKRAEAQEALERWYPAGLDMFGRAASKKQHDYIRWGLRQRTNEEMRRDFIAEVNPILEALGLAPPDPLANRRFV